MSPRAAWRLESLGFREVYDYVAGKEDWFANGLPVEGKRREPIIADVMDRDVPTCDIGAKVGDIRSDVEQSGWDRCMVVGDDGVVLGMVGRRGLSADADTRVEEVMREGPSTFRPNVPVREILEYMTKHALRAAPVTTSEGKLMGMIRREVLERAVDADGEETG